MELHKKVIEAVIKAEEITKSHENHQTEKLSVNEKLGDLAFQVVSSWKSLFVFALIILSWIVYNLTVPLRYSFDRFPFLLMTLILAGIAALQAPLIMMSQQRQNDKNSRRLAANLKVENEILALHQSIMLLMEQQIQQVLENQLITQKLLKNLDIKKD